MAVAINACAHNSRRLIVVTENRGRSLIQSQDQLESSIAESWQPVSCIGCALLRLGGRNEEHKCAVVYSTVHQVTCLHIIHKPHTVESNIGLYYSILLCSWHTNTSSHLRTCRLQCMSQIMGNNSSTMLWSQHIMCNLHLSKCTRICQATGCNSGF